MRMHVRVSQAARWPAMGLTGAILLLAGCGFSQTPSTAASTGTPTPGHVIVATGKSQYAPSEAVDVTIANGLSSGILAADHQSDCTVLLIEHLSSQTWQSLNPCLLKTPTRLIAFNVGSVTSQQLQPPSGQGASGWPAGTYRIAFTYRKTSSGPETTIYSAQFTIA